MDTARQLIAHVRASTPRRTVRRRITTYPRQESRAGMFLTFSAAILAVGVLLTIVTVLSIS